MLSLPKHLARIKRDINPDDASEMLRRAQHDDFYFLLSY